MKKEGDNMRRTKNTINGSVRPRPNKENVRYYEVILELGKDEYGRRKRAYFKCETADRVEAENMLTMKKAEYLNGELIESLNDTVADFLDEYMEDYVKVQSSPATVRDYQEVIDKYLKPTFGKIKLQELTKPKIQQVYNRWRVKSPLSDKPLRSTTIHHINRVFKAGLNVAIELDYIKTNPAKGIKIGKDEVSQHMDVYTNEEIRGLQKAVRGTDMELPVALLFDCVLRRGELLGLRYSDIDFDNNTITVQYTWVESNSDNKPVLKDCKTECSYRTMVVSDYTMRLLRKQRLKYMKNRLKYGSSFCNSDRVICKENGEPYLPKSFTHKWINTLKKYGLRHIKLHGTRHSAISFLLSEGVPLHIVQQRAGHADPKITLGVYSHVAKDRQTVAAETFENVLFKAVNQ